MADEFIGEPITPAAGMLDAARMAQGWPGLPARFRWRGREYPVLEVLERWKTTGDCRSGSDEKYVRKHWFRIRTSDGCTMKLYFERQARSGQTKRRWWLQTLSSPAEPGEPAQEAQ